MLLLELPEDVLLLVLAELSGADILSVSQTCRGLHVLASKDYVWHQRHALDLPLDIPDGTKSTSLPAAQLQKSYVRALRLEHNWRNDVSKIRGMHRIEVGNIVSQIQFLGKELLMAVSRSPTNTFASLWHIAVPEHPRRVISFPTQTSLVFSASVIKESEEVIFAIINGAASYICIHSITWKNKEEDPFADISCRLMRKISKAPLYGTISQSKSCRNIVVANLAKFSLASMPTFRILMIDTETGSDLVIDPQIPRDFLHMTICLCQQYLVIVGEHKQQFIISYYELAPILKFLRERSASSIATNEEFLLETPSLRYESRSIPDFPDFAVAVDDNGVDIPSISILSFNSQAAFQNRNNMVNLFWFRPSAGSRPEDQVSELRFVQPRSAVQDIVCLGRSGRRAAWLQRMWSTDAFELMKGSFVPDKVTVMDLFASRLALPFEISTVQTIAFDEASGRVCLGLHTGEIYLFEF